VDEGFFEPLLPPTVALPLILRSKPTLAPAFPLNSPDHLGLIFSLSLPAPLVSPLWLIDPHAKEHAIGSVELWHRAAAKAIGLLEHDATALRAWAEANAGTFAAVAARYPDTMKNIRAMIDVRLEETIEQEPAE
jgi:hypothetical protein